MRSRRPRGKEEVDEGDREEERKLLKVKRPEKETAGRGSVPPPRAAFHTNRHRSTVNRKKKHLNLVQPPMISKAFSRPSSYLCEVRKRDVRVPILPSKRLRLSEFEGLAVEPVMGKARTLHLLWTEPVEVPSLSSPSPRLTHSSLVRTGKIPVEEQE